MRGSTRASRRLGVLGVLAVAVVTAGCSSPATNRAGTTTTRPARRTTTTTTTSTTTTTTTAPAPTTTAPPVPSSHVAVQISGASATIVFASSAVSGSLNPETGTFSHGGTVYTFVISGVRYSGTPSSASAAGGLISSVTVSGGSGGATVTVKLSSPASHASYGLGHDEVGVSFT